MKYENNVKVSVCCLAYNHEKYIRETLEGFVRQETNFLFEVIIHDDASTDKTVEIIREYQEKYPHLIKTILQQENQYSKGKDVLMEYLYPAASGKYLCFCEGDDYWCDVKKIQTQYEIMEQYPECSICTHKVQCINEDGSGNQRVIPEDFYKISEGMLSEKEICQALWVRGGYPFHTSSLFLKREVIVRLCRDIDIFQYFNGDMNLLHASICEGQFYYIDKEMSRRRLWSIGNWNSRFRDSDIKKKVEFYKKQFQGELVFDSYTNHKYERYIKSWMLNNIFIWSEYDRKAARQYLKEYHLFCHLFHEMDWEHKVNWKYKIKGIFCYVAIYWCPVLFQVKKRMKRGKK